MRRMSEYCLLSQIMSSNFGETNGNIFMETTTTKNRRKNLEELTREETSERKTEEKKLARKKTMSFFSFDIIFHTFLLLFFLSFDFFLLDTYKEKPRDRISSSSFLPSFFTFKIHSADKILWESEKEKETVQKFLSVFSSLPFSSVFSLSLSEGKKRKRKEKRKRHFI